MGPTAPTLTGYMTVNEAAELTGSTPWEIRRLIEAGQVQSLVLVNAASLEDLQEKS